MTNYYAHQAARQRFVQIFAARRGNQNLIKYLNKKWVDLNEKYEDRNTSILLSAFLKKNRTGQSF